MCRALMALPFREDGYRYAQTVGIQQVLAAETA